MASAGTNGFDKDPDRARRAGAKGKKKSPDKVIHDFFLGYLSKKAPSPYANSENEKKRKRIEWLVEAAYSHFVKGNVKPLEFLIKRGYGDIKHLVFGNLDGEGKTVEFSLTPEQKVKAAELMEQVLNDRKES